MRFSELSPPVDEEYQRLIGGGDHDVIGSHWVELFRLTDVLPRGGAILDIGSGIGRVGVALADHFDGEYVGVDVHRGMVEWCQQVITPKNPKLRFEWLDVENGMYRPDGGQHADRAALPFPAGSFDMVFLGSVFTHMPLPGVRNYIREARRVLKPSGVLLASMFLLNGESRGALARGETKQPFPHRYYRLNQVYDPRCVEIAVAYDERATLSLMQANGLAVQRVIHGHWSRPDWTHAVPDLDTQGRACHGVLYQDIVIARATSGSIRRAYAYVLHQFQSRVLPVR